LKTVENQARKTKTAREVRVQSTQAVSVGVNDSRRSAWCRADSLSERKQPTQQQRLRMRNDDGEFPGLSAAPATDCGDTVRPTAILADRSLYLPTLLLQQRVCTSWRITACKGLFFFVACSSDINSQSKIKITRSWYHDSEMILMMTATTTTTTTTTTLQRNKCMPILLCGLDPSSVKKS